MPPWEKRASATKLLRFRCQLLLYYFCNQRLSLFLHHLDKSEIHSKRRIIAKKFTKRRRLKIKKCENFFSSKLLAYYDVNFLLTFVFLGKVFWQIFILSKAQKFTDVDQTISSAFICNPVVVFPIFYNWPERRLVTCVVQVRNGL